MCVRRPVLAFPKRGYAFVSFTIQHAMCACTPRCSSHGRLSATPGTVARQAPASMEFSRQEYWTELPCPPHSTVWRTVIQYLSFKLDLQEDDFSEPLAA